MIKVLLINNYDSFVYNIKQILDESGLCQTDIILNDKISLSEASKYDKIIISPGPGLPKESGNIIKIIKELSPTKNILGICLGFQAIAEVFGGELYQLDKIYHGHQSEVEITDKNESIFKSISSPFLAGRYHSWALKTDSFPKELIVTSRTYDGIIMSFRHAKFDVCGVLFHPESIMTPAGKIIIKNWLNIK